jgi:hypothetical protein
MPCDEMIIPEKPIGKKHDESEKTLGKNSRPKNPVILDENEHSRSEEIRKPRKKPL